MNNFLLNNHLYLESYGYFELPCLIQSSGPQYALYLTLNVKLLVLPRK
ncbi:hypothetical protein [Vibrio gallaecicus]|nr:hypothetical protein [Vibrio gallaecicus]MDN3614883.1 hypothetical protein [Vibrio gallaecicus]